MIWKQKSTAVLGLALFFAIILFVQMAMFLVNTLFGPLELFNIFNFCVSIFEKGTFAYYAVLIIVNVYIFYTVFMIGKKIIQQVLVLQSFQSKIHHLMNKGKSQQINQIYNRKNDDIVVINHNNPLAFTFGFANPVIVLSTTLIEMLDAKELEAVIYHETSHQRYYDGIKVFILQMISESIWYIPLTRWSYQNYRIMIELVADIYAINRMGSELGLGSALLKLIKKQLKINTNLTPAMVHFADSTVDYRLQQLINPQQSIPVKVETRTIVISLNVFILILLLLVIA
ncbi:M48 family metalloprotease [Neobacillus sp. MER 74]|uniref:M56 family metallopeptidase n=1 Tax=Neobacillus sp. MER 74 TaxID=2939566 RepID=UPI00204253FC|nr:M56 family metallopeptidase [Neobacillus sp. MER 74]MCM3117194.1 M48 family metalloprotease [Neobacillus sp. MER 74]